MIAIITTTPSVRPAPKRAPEAHAMAVAPEAATMATSQATRS